VSQDSSHPKVGVLIAQLGTPDAPTAQALRPYLNEFLSDRRVIDYHPLIWQPILKMILARRPKRSAQLYARIWHQSGSPLLYYSNRIVDDLQRRLGSSYRVILGMTYGNPNIRDAIKTLEREGIHRIIVLPMFPQYSSTTTASIYDAVYDASAGKRGFFNHANKRFVPTLRFIDRYYDDPRFIAVLRAHLLAEIDKLPHKPDQYIISYHGIPNRYVQTGDPYRQQCEHNTRLLVDAMGWGDEEWTMSFQSQFGPEEWLQPYTEDVLTELAQKGVKRPLVFSPGFVTDCLETLDELGNEGREQFEEGGGHGDDFTLASCLNDAEVWLDYMETMIIENAGGWVGVVSRETSAQNSYAAD
jgi:ferrochelatase